MRIHGGIGREFARPNFGVKLARPDFGPAAELPTEVPSATAARRLVRQESFEEEETM